MDSEKNLENDRAFRIQLRIKECHMSLADIYEKLVDREFDSVTKDIKTVIAQMRLILKSMEDDDF